MNLTELTLPPFAKAEGTLQPPGSKSIANRALPLAAVGKGLCRLKNLPDGEDVKYMIAALKKCGVNIEQMESDVPVQGSEVLIQGQAGGLRLKGESELFIGNSGTCIRFLTALLSAGRGECSLDGIERMRERPIGDLVDGLRQWMAEGSSITYLNGEGFPPLRIQAEGLRGGRATIPANLSSQYITAMLMAMPLCREKASLEITGSLVSASYVGITLEMLKQWVVSLEAAGNYSTFSLSHPAGYVNPAEYIIEADASSASYFLAAGAIGGGPVTVEGVGRQTLQWPSEGGFAGVLEQMGARVRVEAQRTVVSSGKLKGIEVNMDNMSDTGMTLAVTALFAEGPTVIRGIGNWRLKETDRLAAMATELRKVGAEVEESESSLRITPPKAFQTAVIETYGDHRMAMCFSLVTLAGVPVTLKDPYCVQKTYPLYFEDLRKVLRP